MLKWQHAPAETSFIFLTVKKKASAATGKGQRPMKQCVGLDLVGNFLKSIGDVTKERTNTSKAISNI